MRFSRRNWLHNDIWSLYYPRLLIFMSQTSCGVVYSKPTLRNKPLLGGEQLKPFRNNKTARHNTNPTLDFRKLCLECPLFHFSNSNLLPYRNQISDPQVASKHHSNNRLEVHTAWFILAVTNSKRR